MRQKLQTLTIILLAALLMNSFAYAGAESAEPTGEAENNTGVEVSGTGALLELGQDAPGLDSITTSDALGSVAGSEVSQSAISGNEADSDGNTVSDSDSAGFGSTASDNDTASGSTVSDNTASGNAASGTVSDNTVSGNTVSGNTVSDNTVSGNTVSGNTVSDNTVSGNTVSDNTVSGNTVSGNTVSGNTASGNTVSGNTASGTVSGNTTSGTVSGNAASGTVSDDTVSGSDTANNSGQISTGDSQGVVSDGDVSGSDQDVSGNITVLQNPNALQAAAFSMKVPKSLNFIMDPYEISGKGSVWSQDYGFENRGNAAVKLCMRDLRATAREGISVGKDMELTGGSDKNIALWFRMNNGDNVPITEDSTSYEVILKPGESLIFQVAGKMNASDLWESGDLCISMVYQVGAVVEKE